MRALSSLAVASALCVGCASDPPPSPASTSATPVISAPIRSTEVTVVQRRSEPVPGSGGRLRIAIGDVTGGQVLVRVVDARTGRDVLPQRSMRVGDVADLVFDSHRYGVVLKQLVNLLIGDDFAVVALTSPAEIAATRIDALLLRVETSSATFVRAGVELDGVAAARQLRREWAGITPEERDLDAFIERISTRSSFGGDEDQVRLPGGRTVPLSAWLRGEPDGG